MFDSTSDDQGITAFRMTLHQHFQTEHGPEGFGLEHLLRRAQHMRPAFGEQQQAIAVTRGEVEVMKNDQHRDATLGEDPNGL